MCEHSGENSDKKEELWFVFYTIVRLYICYIHHYAYSTEEAFQQDFRGILKHSLQNISKISNKCSLLVFSSELRTNDYINHHIISWTLLINA